MRAGDFRNTIGPMLPANIREIVMAEIEERDRLMARLTNERDANLLRIVELGLEDARLRLRLNRMTRLLDDTNKALVVLADRHADGPIAMPTGRSWIKWFRAKKGERN